MIVHQYSFIFVHIPKTAGNSIEDVFFDFCSLEKECFRFYNEQLKHFDHHLTLPEIRSHKVSETQFKSYFKFSFVRNPWDRAVSAAMYRNMALRDFLLADFSCFDGLRQDPERHRLPQYEFIFDDEGKQLCDFVGRFENLEDDFNFVCERIGIPRQKLPHRNKSNHNHYTTYYDDETREIVARKYAKDITHFAYEFGR